jgi:hypothetical protein
MSGSLFFKGALVPPVEPTALKYLLADKASVGRLAGLLGP